MHINFDHAEDLEMLIAQEFNNEPSTPHTPSGDAYEAGYKILDNVSCDLALENGILDLDELN